MLGRVLLAGGLLASCGLAGCDRGDHPGNIGKLAPEFKVTDAVRTVDLRDLRGKVVVLNLWATWCPPCLEELPSLLAMQHQLPGVVVVAVSIDQDEAVYRKFLAQHQVDLLTVRDPEETVNTMYGTKQIPETYIIDRNGILRRKFVSSQDWTSPEIEGYLKRLEAGSQ